MCPGVVVLQDARLDTGERIPTEAEFNRWILLPINDEELPGEIVVSIVDAAEMRQLNLDYRKIDKPTNVLSFSYDDHAEAGFGDIVICASVLSWKLSLASLRMLPKGSLRYRDPSPTTANSEKLYGG